MRPELFTAVIAFALLLGMAGATAAEYGPAAAPTTRIAVQALPAVASPHAQFDPVKATNAYLSEVKGPARARSDRYFEGGYVLIFVDTLYAVGVSALLLWLRISARMRDYAKSLTRSRFLQVPVYVALYLALVTVLTFPLSVYESFLREHAFGLSNQTFARWLGDFSISFGVTLVLFTILATVIYSVIRTAPRTWWIWSTLAAVAFLAFTTLVQPVVIAPLYNHYRPLRPGPLKTEILTLARSEGVPASDIYEFDASRQSRRISANVSGFLGTTRISLNDNLLNRCTRDEILAIVGHEIGHYVLDHGAILITWFGLLLLVGFAFVNGGFRFLTGLFGANWNVRTLDDPAGLPVATALFGIFMLVATPVSNTITRTLETQADIFGLNAARRPDGFAKATLMLSEYRKLDPSPLEELVFYDHPSGRSRIFMAMRWKAGHLNDPDIAAGPISPQ